MSSTGDKISEAARNFNSELRTMLSVIESLGLTSHEKALLSRVRDKLRSAERISEVECIRRSASQFMKWGPYILNRAEKVFMTMPIDADTDELLVDVIDTARVKYTTADTLIKDRIYVSVLRLYEAALVYAINKN